MPEGTIRTIFQSDPDGILAAHARIKAAQKEMEEGYQRTGKAGKQMGYDLDAALGMVDQKAIELNRHFKEAYLGIEAGARSAANSIKAAFMDLNVAMGGTARPDGWGLLSGMGRGQLDIARERDKWTELGRAGAATLRMFDDGQTKHNTTIRQTTSLMADWGRQLLGIAAGYVGIQQSVSALMGVHQEMTQMHSAAAGAMANATPIQQGLAEAFPNGNDFQLAMKGATEISKKYGIPLQELNQVLRVTSSKNEGNLERALSITEVTAQAKRFGMGQEGGQYSLGISNLMNAIPGLNAEQASSMLQVIGQKGSIVSQGMIAEHITPAALASIANADLTKVTRQEAVAEALAGASTLAKFGSDEEGRLAFTNWQGFSEKAKEFAEKQGIEFKGTPMATMRAMSAEQRKSFGEALGGEQRMKPFVSLLAIMQEEQSNRFFDDMRQSIYAESVGAGKMHRDLAERLEGATPAMRVSVAAGRLKAIVGDSELNKEIEAAAAVSAEAMTHFQTAEKTIMGSAEGQPGQRIGMTFDQWLNNAGQGTKNLFRTPMGQLEARREYMKSEINRFENVPEVRNVAMRSPQYSAQLEEMKQLLSAIENLIEVINKNNEATAANTEATEGGVDPNRRGFQGFQWDQEARKNRP